MKREIKYGWILAALLITTSCEDILEEDITGDQITALNPREGDIVEGNTVQFLWNPIDGADDYLIQIYDENLLVLDSLVGFPPFTLIMDNDTYEWRIKGINSAYETDFNFPVSFQVVTSEDLSNQTVLLQSPTENLYTNVSSIIFVWEAIESADTYTFQLEKITSSGSSVIHLENGITGTSLQLDNTVLTEDAEYRWNVKAVNETSESDFFSRTFFIDTVLPPTPTLLTPGFEEQFDVDMTVVFSWDFGTDPGTVDSPITSTYEVATDNTFINIVENGTIGNETTTLSFSTAGTYYWRVKGEDAAGNVGTYNENGKLIIND